MSARPARPGERGSILLMVLVFIAMMSLLGALTMRAVSMEIDVVGAERQGEHAFYTAEAGLQWGRLELVDEFGPDLNYTTMFSGGAGVGGLVLVLINEPGKPLDGWYGVGTQSYAGGTFRVAIKDDAVSETPGPGNKTILMRSLGRGPGASQGAERLIEITLLEE